MSASVHKIPGLGIVHITEVGNYKPGDLPPVGYLEWHAWAEVQRKARIKQVQCKCGLWCTPQELSGKVEIYQARDRKGNPVPVETPICLKCPTNKLEV